MPLGTSNPTLPGCGFHHISIQTEDIDASIRFYRDVLGMSLRLEFRVGERRFALLDLGDGGYVELQAKPATAPALAPTPQGGAEASAPAAPVAHYALAVSDTRAAIERVRAAGYPVTVEPKEVDLAGKMPATVAFFSGPSGESVELFQEH